MNDVEFTHTDCLLENQGETSKPKKIKINKTKRANRVAVSCKTRPPLYIQTRLRHLTFDLMRVMDKNTGFMISPINTDTYRENILQVSDQKGKKALVNALTENDSEKRYFPEMCCAYFLYLSFGPSSCVFGNSRWVWIFNSVAILARKT